jgi:hypothetical protein
MSVLCHWGLVKLKEVGRQLKGTRVGSGHAYLPIRPRSSQLCALLIVMRNLKLDKCKPRRLANYGVMKTLPGAR